MLRVACNVAQRYDGLNSKKCASRSPGRAAAHVSTKKPSPQHMAVLLPVWPPPPSMRNSVVGLTCAPRRRRWPDALARGQPAAP
jgi:hypothetical protein